MKFRFLFIIFAAVLCFGGCRFFFPDDEEENKELQVINQTGQTIYYLYCKPETYDDWGKDKLGDDFLENNNSVKISLDNYDGNVFDLKAVDWNNREYIIRNIDIKSRSSVNISPSDFSSEYEDIEITNIYWLFKNFDSDFEAFIWDEDDPGSCFMSYKLEYRGTEIGAEDLVSLTAENGNICFEAPLERDIYSNSDLAPSTHYIDGIYTYGNDEDYFPLGPWTFNLEFKDGLVKTYQKTFPRPGSSQVITNAYWVTEDFGYSGSMYYPTVKRATLTRAEFESATGDFIVEFQIDDDLTQTGYIVFYDEDGDFVDKTDYFYNDQNAVDNHLAGNMFYTDGTTNVFTSNLSELPDLTVDLSIIYYAVIALFDGKQYLPYEDVVYYDCKSYSAPMAFTVVY